MALEEALVEVMVVLLMVNFKTVNIMDTFGAYTKMATVNNLYIKTINLWNIYERLIYTIFLTYYYIFIVL